MKTNRESIPRTMLIAACVAIVCSAMVTTAVNYLRPRQAAFAAIERNRVIAIASGAPETASDQALISAFLRLRAEVVDLDTGEPVEHLDGHMYDHWLSASSTNPRLVPVYSEFIDGHLNRLILPVHGQGMWSRIQGYITLQRDLNTIASLVIYQHGETPGIGDKIEDGEWLSAWAGKKILDTEDRLQIDVSNDLKVEQVYRVDGITGATVTSNAVGKLVRKRLGPDGYQGLLTRLKHQVGESP